MSIRYFFGIVICLLFTVNSFAQIQFKFNNVDTISQINRDLIAFFGEFIKVKSSRQDDRDFWCRDGNFELSRNDSYEPWIYGMFSHQAQTILGLSKVSENQYNVKVMLETGEDSLSTIIYAIQNFIIKETPKGFKMQDVLAYRLHKGNYRLIEDKYFDFYIPDESSFSKEYIDEINLYVKSIEDYFDKKVPFKMRYIYAPGCEALYHLRGYDYVANMMSTKSNVCGLTDPEDRIMFSSSSGLHKHELLRLLTVIFPKRPAILMDGFTNLVGGSAGKPIMYHLRKLAPYILGNPSVLDSLDSFYYYDDETNPHFVFNAIATNYFIKERGEGKLKEFMRREDLSRNSLTGFLKNYCAVNDIKSFFETVK